MYTLKCEPSKWQFLLLFFTLFQAYGSISFIILNFIDTLNVLIVFLTIALYELLNSTSGSLGVNIGLLHGSTSDNFGTEHIADLGMLLNHAADDPLNVLIGRGARAAELGDNFLSQKASLGKK